MADPTHSRPPPGPAPEAAVRRLVDALTTPGTAEELQDERAYVAAFLASGEARNAAGRPTAGDGAGGRRTWRGRRTVRIALNGGIAALAVTGTAAAVTGAVAGMRPSQPARTSQPSDAPSTPARPPGTGVHATSPQAPSPSSAAATTATPPSPRRSTSSPTPTASGPGSGSGTGSGTANGRPSTAPAAHPATQALVNFCRRFTDGRLPVRSGGYRALAEAAGSPTAIPAYCASIAPPTPGPHTR
jgi:hypothetical protein